MINEKVIAVFLVSMITVIAFSTYLSNVDKEDLQKAVDELIKVAKQAGGNDNITAILAEV